MAEIRARVEVSSQFRKTMRTLRQPHIGRIFQRALERGAFKVQELAAAKYILRSGPKDVVHPTMLTSRTGNLRRDIRVDRSGLPMGISIGTGLIYGELHELGIGFRPRPFLQPALDEVMTRHMDRFLKVELERELDRASR